MKPAVVLALALAACSGPKNAFECTDNASCRNGSTTGTCEPNGYCSFPDGTCPSGARYGAASGSLASLCVGDEMGSDAPPGLGAWVNGAAVPVTRYTHATVTNSNDFYVLGGILGMTKRSDVWFTHVNTTAVDPSLVVTSWTQTTSLPSEKRTFGAAYYAGFIYAVGGATLSGDSAEVLAAPVNADGTVGAWTLTTPLPLALRCHAVASSGAHLYVIGGKPSGASPTAKDWVLRADMSNGTVTSWQSAGTLDTTLFNASAIAVNGYLYVIGGCASGRNLCSPPLDIVEVAKINSDGTLGPFAHTTPLPMARSHHTTAASASKQELFVLTGKYGTMSSDPAVPDVIVAHINSDGTLGAWHPTPPLIDGRERATAAVVGNYLLVVAGDTQLAPLQ